MAITFDLYSANWSGQDPSWTHAADASASCAIGIGVLDGIANAWEGMQYNSIELTDITGSPFTPITNAENVTKIAFDGACAGGSQTIAQQHGANPLREHGCITLIADAEVVEQDTATLDASAPGQNPDCTTEFDLGGNNSFVCLIANNSTGTITAMSARAGYTELLESDFGTNCIRFDRYNTIGSTNFTAGFDNDADNAANILAVAFAETSGAVGDNTIIIVPTGPPLS